MGRRSEANMHPLCMYAPTGPQSHSGRRYGKQDDLNCTAIKASLLHVKGGVKIKSTA